MKITTYFKTQQSFILFKRKKLKKTSKDSENGACALSDWYMLHTPALMYVARRLVTSAHFQMPN